jgi:hypothetical protein
MKRSVGAIFVILSCLALAPGCSGQSGTIQFAPADGTVTYQGKPLSGATVTLAPDKGPLAMTVTDENGKFAFANGSQPGVAVGSVKVGIIAMPPRQISPADVAAVSKPAQTEEEAAAYLQKAGEMQKKMAENPEAERPKSLIPEKYTRVDTSGLSFTIKANNDNHLTIELKD